jgi:hypothetical protein
VHTCKSIDVTMLGNDLDYAVFQLQSAVSASVATPVAIQSTEVSVNTQLMMIGHPSGLPRKYAGDASVRQISSAGLPEYRFHTDLDSFGGNSGSGVFNAATKEMVGILVSFTYESTVALSLSPRPRPPQSTSIHIARPCYTNLVG